MVHKLKKMDNLSSKTFRMNGIKTKVCKICNIRCFRVCHRGILLILLLTFVINSVLGELMKGVPKTEVENQREPTENKFSGTRGGTSSSAISIKVNNFNHYVNKNICLKEHTIEKREVPEDEILELKQSKDKTNDKAEKVTEADEYGYGSSEETFETSECASCSKERIRMSSLETIKKSILSRLGMSQPPNVTGWPKPKISNYQLTALKRINRRKMQHQNSNGLHWIAQEDDLDEMLGDEPHDFHASDKVSSKKSHGTSDKYSDSTNLQDVETVEFEEEDNYQARTEKIVAFSQPHTKIRHVPNIHYFEFGDRLKSNKVKRALLWIYIKGRETTSAVGDKINISIYKILDTGKSLAGGLRESPIVTSVKADSTQLIPKGSGAWITIDYVQIKNLVADWLKNPQHNLGIIIIAEDANGTNLAVTERGGNETGYLPFLEVHVSDSRKHRTKRTVGLNCKDSSRESRCCRYPLTVDFVEFGWDWVIAPKRYEAFYCAGECPPSFLPQHPHTHISQLARVTGNGPCCAPRKLSELEMLYFDQNMNIIFGRIPAMRVDRCGCT